MVHVGFCLDRDNEPVQVKPSNSVYEKIHAFLRTEKSEKADSVDENELGEEDGGGDSEDIDVAALTSPIDDRLSSPEKKPVFCYVIDGTELCFRWIGTKGFSSENDEAAADCVTESPSPSKIGSLRVGSAWLLVQYPYLHRLHQKAGRP
jgi:hypothetical protein